MSAFVICERETPKQRVEMNARGINEFYQLAGTDPYRSLTSSGLRVPPLPTPDLDSRYLFLMAVMQLGYGIKYRVRGIRLGFSLFADVGNADLLQHYPEEIEVESPFFTFSDGGGVSWHLRTFQFDAIQKNSFGPLDTDNFIWRIAHTPALLYETAHFPAQDLNPAGKPDFYTTMTSYTPPRKGQPPGDALIGDWGTFYDLRVWNRSDTAWVSLDIPVQAGDEAIGLFACVRQTNPETRPQPVLTNPLPNPGGLAREERFLQNFPTKAKIGRVFGGFILEEA